MRVLDGHGELAFISSRRESRRQGILYLAGGAGRLRRVSLPGPATAPAWSPDHRWLEVRVAPAPPPNHPFAYEPSAVFVVRADGGGVRRLTPLSRDVTDSAWSPTADVLAVTSFRRHQGHGYRVDLQTPTAPSHRTVVTAKFVSGIAWSSDGTALAVSAPIYDRRKVERLRWTGDILTVDAETDARRTIAAQRGVILDLAGWTPDGQTILYWPDPMGSGSIAADGLPLYAVRADGGTAHRISNGGLVHPSWLAFAPGGATFSVADGHDRTVWGHHKHVDVCAASTPCVRQPQPRTKVSLWPAWAPDGTQVFARLTWRRLDGPFYPRSLAQWTSYSRLFEVRHGEAPEPVLGVPVGATAPSYAADGTLLFIRGSSIWLKPPGSPARRAVTLVGGLHVGNYYGFIPYRQLIAWTDERPGSFGGTS
jgi:dipeptidyl aminopeptidase/acylaminoacyl peptidase